VFRVEREQNARAFGGPVRARGSGRPRPGCAYESGIVHKRVCRMPLSYLREPGPGGLTLIFAPGSFPLAD
jgi:hypothetical protein